MMKIAVGDLNCPDVSFYRDCSKSTDVSNLSLISDENNNMSNFDKRQVVMENENVTAIEIQLDSEGEPLTRSSEKIIKSMVKKLCDKVNQRSSTLDEKTKKNY